MTRSTRETLTLAVLVAVLCALALLAGCATCQIPAATQCSGDAVQVCAGGYWRTVRDCRDVGPAAFTCIEEPGQVAACMPRGEP